MKTDSPGPHFGHKSGDSDGTFGQSTSGPSPTHQMSLPWQKKKEKLSKWVTGLALVENKREERSTLVAGIPLITLNSRWEILLLETYFSPEPLSTIPLDYPTQSILSLFPEVLALYPGYPSMCLCGTLAEKGPISFPAGQSQQEKMHSLLLL